MPKYDNFLIRKELIIEVSIWIVAAVWFTIVILSELQRNYVIVATLSQFVAMLGSMGVMYCTILYPLRKLSRDNNDRNSGTPSTPSSETISKTMAWTEYVTQSKDNFNKFMQHLTKEWAVENLCFILEIMQFKQKWMENGQGSGSVVDDDKIGYYFELSQDLPRSDIVYLKQGEDEDGNMKQQILLLSEKYITDRADLCVNISYITRMVIFNKIDELKNENELSAEKKGELLLLFDGSLKEIAKLLDDAWRRFRTM